MQLQSVCRDITINLSQIIKFIYFLDGKFFSIAHRESREVESFFEEWILVIFVEKIKELHPFYRGVTRDILSNE